MKKFFLFLLLPFFLQGTAYIKQDTHSLTLGNPFFELKFFVDQNQLDLNEIINKKNQSKYRFKGDLFQITTTYLGEDITPPRNTPAEWNVKDFSLQSVQQKSLHQGKEIIFNFSGHSFQLALHLQIPDNQPHLKLFLTLKAEEDASVFIEKIAVFQGKLPGLKTRLGGFGQPLYGDDLFFGIEFPAAYAQANQQNEIRCWYRVGRKLTVDQVYYSYQLVIGFSTPESVEKDFFKYLRSLRPRPDRPFALYNTWYDIRDFSYDKLMKTIRDFKSTLIDRYGLKLDAFVIDDGWDDVHSVWEIDRQKFPEGFKPLKEELQKLNSHLGLWISPWNGYDKARNQRVQWAKQHGYKTSGTHLCLGDDQYFNIFKNKTLQYLKEADLSFYKIDGFLSVCNESDHNHLPGIYSRTALTERFIDILKALRATKPNIFLDLTVGTWLSPWWLQYADALWMTGADYGHAEDVPAYSERDKAITFRDYTLYKDFVVEKFQFPLSNVMTHGIIKGRLNLLGGKDETMRDWMNNVVMYFARGVMMWELYLTPEILSQQEWDFLANVMRWTYRNQDLLKNTRFLGGNPYNKEIYGYLHEQGKNKLIILRNPFVKPQRVSLKYKDLFAEEQTSYLVKTIFPQNNTNPDLFKPGQTLSVDLQGYEVRAISFQPYQKEMAPTLAGVGLKPLNTTDNSITYELYSDQNFKSVSLMAKDQIKKLMFNQHQINPHDFEEKINSLTGKNSPIAMPAYCIDAFNAQEISGRLQNLKANNLIEARLGLLLEFREQVDSLSVKLSNQNGQINPIVKKGAGGKWFWILLPLDSLKQFLTFEIKNGTGQDFPETQFSAWLLGYQKLARVGTLTIQTKKPWFKSSSFIPTNSDQKWFTRQIFSLGF